MNTKSGIPSVSATAVPSTWKEIVEPVRPFLEDVGRRLICQIQAFDPEIAAYAEYALTNQGKQLRPVLVALSGDAVGRLNDELAELATIIEMVHLATLVHDDVMDSAELRRQRPTLAANWGNEISVLVGDCLFAQAVKLAASFPTPDVCRAVASATNRVCSGEILQTRQRGKTDLERSEYFRILEMKTAELFALSCGLGGELAGGHPFHCDALRRYGTAFGIAYQIYDDCVDLCGNEAMAGKSLGTDLAGGKLTLPLLIVLEQGVAEDRARLRNWIERRDSVLVPQVMALLDRYNAVGESRDVIRDYLETAQVALDELPESPSRESLAAMTEFLAEQTDRFKISS